MNEERAERPPASSHDLSPTEIAAEAERRVREHQQSDPQRRAQLRLNRVVFSLSKHWLALFNTLAGLYAGLPILAPVLMHYGYPRPAHLIYAFYTHLCHQYPIRSWFLFGMRPHYTVESGLLAVEVQKSYQFLGDANLGYKIAFCQRDVAIYGMMFLAGLLYVLLRHRWKIPALPLWAYLLFGLLPMGLDGGYQLLANFITWLKPGWITPHETTPVLRTLTGALFGLSSIGVTYPLMEEFFEDTKNLLAARYNWRL
ncbi:MAG: DUF2085 domain-containing protein [Anaerolineae bacterium]|nr:DUF2085 domain-containing protein [Anaerolineae bacterium]